MEFTTAYFRIIPKFLNNSLYMMLKLPSTLNRNSVLIEDLPEEYFAKEGDSIA